MPGRFLIIQTAFIGDAILATALLEDLHRAWPNAKIDLMVRRGNESLFVDHPFINELLIWEKKTSKYRSLWQLLGQIRATPYKAVINLQRFGATGLLTAFSGAGITIGFDKNPFSALFTYSIPHQIGPTLHGVRSGKVYPTFALPQPQFGLPSNTRPAAGLRLSSSCRPTGVYICWEPPAIWGPVNTSALRQNTNR